MKKFIIVIISIMLLCGCARVSDVSQQVSIETTSEVSGTYSSEPISSDKSSQVYTSTAISQTSSEYDIPKRPNLEIECDNKEFMKRVFSYAKYHNYEQIGDNDLAYEILELIQNNLNIYYYYFLKPTLEFDGYNEVNEDVYVVDNSIYTLTFDWLSRIVNETYMKAEAEKILNNPLYSEKRYHYFEKDNNFYIDQTVAKTQNFIPYDFVAYIYTYRYFIDYFTFDYEQIDETHILAKAIFYDQLDQRFVKLPLTAVLEDGKWKLEKMVLEEDIVPVE